MAASDKDRSPEDLTEEASSYRLEELRQKGQVAHSKELTTCIAFLGILIAYFFLYEEFFFKILEYFKYIFDFSFYTDKVFFSKYSFWNFGKMFLYLITPLGFSGVFFAIVGAFVQIGPLFSFEPLNFNIEKLNFFEGLKRIFSQKVFFEIGKIIFKLFILFIFFYFLLQKVLVQSHAFLWTSLINTFMLTGKSIQWLALGGLFIFLAFAAFDVWSVRKEYAKKTRLTKQEAKQEAKEREGDPQVKARIRGLQRQMARRRMMQAIKKADVVITNPTHIAVALQYDRKKMKAPKVVAKGADLLAQRIKQIAQESNVLCVENVSLARILYKSVKLGASIPKNLYQAVAEVLAIVYRSKGRTFR